MHVALSVLFNLNVGIALISDMKRGKMYQYRDHERQVFSGVGSMGQGVWGRYYGLVKLSRAHGKVLRAHVKIFSLRFFFTMSALNGGCVIFIARVLRKQKKLTQFCMCVNHLAVSVYERCVRKYIDMYVVLSCCDKSKSSHFMHFQGLLAHELELKEKYGKVIG